MKEKYKYAIMAEDIEFYRKMAEDNSDFVLIEKCFEKLKQFLIELVNMFGMICLLAYYDINDCSIDIKSKKTISIDEIKIEDIVFLRDNVLLTIVK
ncbi:MAG: hypothetical protein FWF56_00055 [Firmicutes bacterium]|nr:hypothetical protein [Bacillota bacterium]MCL1953764.1 hypothetical protein [Bacillota bacterium]